MKAFIMILLVFNMVLWSIVIYVTSKNHLLDRFFNNSNPSEQPDQIIITQTAGSFSPTNAETLLILLIIVVLLIPIVIVFFRKKQK